MKKLKILFSVLVYANLIKQTRETFLNTSLNFILIFKVRIIKSSILKDCNFYSNLCQSLLISVYSFYNDVYLIDLHMYEG